MSSTRRFTRRNAIGAYAAEGLRVDLLAGAARRYGRGHLGRPDAGHEAPRRQPGSPLVCFAEIVCRDPFSIIGRRPNPGFQLADLARMRVATVSEVPTPWVCLQEDLRQAGIDPAQLDRIHDRSMAENLLALREAQLFEPVVEEALASGAGHLWHAASERGRTTYTAFVTTRDRLVGNAEPLRLRRAGREIRMVMDGTDRFATAKPLLAHIQVRTTAIPSPKSSTSLPI